MREAWNVHERGVEPRQGAAALAALQGAVEVAREEFCICSGRHEHHLRRRTPRAEPASKEVREEEEEEIRLQRALVHLVHDNVRDALQDAVFPCIGARLPGRCVSLLCVTHKPAEEDARRAE